MKLSEEKDFSRIKNWYFKILPVSSSIGTSEKKKLLDPLWLFIDVNYCINIKNTIEYCP